MKAREALLAAAAVLIALAAPAGASARGVHRRHTQVIQPTAQARVALGTHGGYAVNLELFEPDLAVLDVSKFDFKRLASAETKYGAHFHGSLVGGRVTADFGAVGSIAVRFRAGSMKERRLPKVCEGKPSREESGTWVGKISLRGEGGYFEASSRAAAGDVDRTFLLNCHFNFPLKLPTPESLRQRTEPQIGASISSVLLGTVSTLEAEAREGGRGIAMRAAHTNGTGPGAEVEAGAFEYQGRMPVGRTVQMLRAPRGTLLTSLPGEHPATATLKPAAPFSGEASYLARSPTDHTWTGDLAVRFPGLVAPLSGPGFFTTLCVVSTLVKPAGCEFQSPSWQSGEEDSTSAARR